MNRANKKTPKALAVRALDLANLRESGLTNDTIRRNHLRTEGNALVFPYRNLANEENCFARRRLHEPVTDAKGRPIKYTQPKGTPPRAYFPVESLDAIADGHSPIFVTEGEKKALALAQHGFATIGIGGVWCWRKKGTDQLIDDLQEVPFAGRDVFIVFDHDEKPKTRRNVYAAARQLAIALRSAGANDVRWVELPPATGDGKQGVDDYLVSHGDAAFRSLVEQAKPLGTDDVPPMTQPSGRTDAANARRLVAKHRNVIRWVGPWDKWLIWDGQRWKLDQELRIEALAKEVAQERWREIADTVAAGNTDKDTVSAMVTFAKMTNSAAGIRNMVSLARSEPGVGIDFNQLDAHPWMLNVENGTLDLRTGKLREHRQDDYLTKLAPVTFDRKAQCPEWREFLQTIFNGNENLITYMQRLVGYSITGVTEEHLLPLLYGIGANGKTTLIESMLKLLGADYAMKAPPDLLMVKRGESHPTERADLFGKRLVACVETEDGRRLAESLVKELTGGDRVRARRMREDHWEFTPTHHVWLAGNYRPTVTGTDYGIWRRIKLIPFSVVIPDDKQDKKLPAKLAAELPGILNWAIEGCLEWQRNGLGEPDDVRAATSQYSAEMDEVGQFIDDQCQCGPDYLAPATELFNAFKDSTGSRMTQRTFGESLKRRGFEKARITSGMHKGRKAWRGVRLTSDAVQDEFEAAMGRQRKGGR